jgi:uncharacterized membrane protein (Fun14 family)
MIYIRVSSILIAAVIIVIIDLGRASHGLIQVSQQRLLELRGSLEDKALQFGR